MATKATQPVITKAGRAAAVRASESGIKIKFSKLEAFEFGYNPSPDDTGIQNQRETIRLLSVRAKPDGLEVAGVFDSDLEYDVGGYALYIEADGGRDVLFAVISKAGEIQAKKLFSEELVFRTFFRLQAIPPDKWASQPPDGNLNISVARELMGLSRNIIATQTEVLKLLSKG
jgi:hypothetical protein